VVNVARTPTVPDNIFVTACRNWAALDGALARGDAITRQIEGSIAAASAVQSARSGIRTVLGSQTMQVLELK
jgi:hypothetical protein